MNIFGRLNHLQRNHDRFKIIYFFFSLDNNFIKCISCALEFRIFFEIILAIVNCRDRRIQRNGNILSCIKIISREGFGTGLDTVSVSSQQLTVNLVFVLFLSILDLTHLQVVFLIVLVKKRMDCLSQISSLLPHRGISLLLGIIIRQELRYIRIVDYRMLIVLI